jgi:hypothetical protein
MHHLSTIQPLFRIYYYIYWSRVPHYSNRDQVVHFSLGTVITCPVHNHVGICLLSFWPHWTDHVGYGTSHYKHEQVVLILESITLVLYK